MHAGRVMVSDSPHALIAARGTRTLEEAFISYLEAVANETVPQTGKAPTFQPPMEESGSMPSANKDGFLSLRRLFSYTRRESLELRRDPIRLTLALLGSAILMFVMGYGISLDVENLTFAVLDRDQTSLSRDYTLNLAGSRYFSERIPIKDYAELDRRMCAGEISLAIEIPAGFGRNLRRGAPVASAPGSTAPCRPALKPYVVMCRACTPTGCRPLTLQTLAPTRQRPLSQPAFATTQMLKACRPWYRQ